MSEQEDIAIRSQAGGRCQCVGECGEKHSRGRCVVNKLLTVSDRSKRPRFAMVDTKNGRKHCCQFCAAKIETRAAKSSTKDVA